MKNKLPNDWIETSLGDKGYFEIISSGINKFSGEKEYLSTESIKKTKNAGIFISNIFEKENKEKVPSKVILALSAESNSSTKFFRNIKNLDVVSFKNLNAHNTYRASFLIVEKKALKK